MAGGCQPEYKPEERKIRLFIPHIIGKTVNENCTDSRKSGSRRQSQAFFIIFSRRIVGSEVTQENQHDGNENRKSCDSDRDHNLCIKIVGVRCFLDCAERKEGINSPKGAFSDTDSTGKAFRKQSVDTVPDSRSIGDRGIGNTEGAEKTFRYGRGEKCRNGRYDD